MKMLQIVAVAWLPVAASADSLSDTKARARAGAFDAETTVPCAQERGQSLGSCTALVAQASDAATVVVRFPNGFARQLYFREGAFIGASATMSGVGRDTDWQIVDGAHLIRVDDQRYEIPDAFVFGG